MPQIFISHHSPLNLILRFGLIWEWSYSGLGDEHKGLRDVILGVWITQLHFLCKFSLQVIGSYMVQSNCNWLLYIYSRLRSGPMLLLVNQRRRFAKLYRICMLMCLWWGLELLALLRGTNWLLTSFDNYQKVKLAIDIIYGIFEPD